MVCLFCVHITGCTREQIVFENSASFADEQENSSPEEGLQETTKEEKEIKETKETTIETEDEKPGIFSIHVCGAVANPSVYQVEEGTRIYQVIEKAGGFLEEADRDYLNLALEVEDGMQIRIPTKEETKDCQVPLLIESGESEKASAKVNLNTAEEEVLCTLPGIGESRAKSIIQYRQEHGSFQRIEDIMKVSGIKEAAYEKIKDYITVSK